MEFFLRYSQVSDTLSFLCLFPTSCWVVVSLTRNGFILRHLFSLNNFSPSVHLFPVSCHSTRYRLSRHFLLFHAQYSTNLRYPRTPVPYPHFFHLLFSLLYSPGLFKKPCMHYLSSSSSPHTVTPSTTSFNLFFHLHLRSVTSVALISQCSSICAPMDHYRG